MDIPDPFVVPLDGVYFMFASEETFYGPNVPLMVSDSLTSWSGPNLDALPVLPKWAGPGFTWSPDVRYVDGRWVMWFNAAVASAGFGGTKCIGVATSTSVIGPYVSKAPEPLVCQLDQLGSIDPRSFIDQQGHLWLLWKSDDNADLAASTHSTIYAQRLSADGLHLMGQPTALLTADQTWEGRIVEAPDMVHAGGHDWLFFSGNWFNQPSYAIGLAECAGPAGPCVAVVGRAVAGLQRRGRRAGGGVPVLGREALVVAVCPLRGQLPDRDAAASRSGQGGLRPPRPRSGRPRDRRVAGRAPGAQAPPGRGALHEPAFPGNLWGLETTTESRPLSPDPAPVEPADRGPTETEPRLHRGLAQGVRLASHAAVWSAVLVPTLTELARGWRAFGDDAAIASRSFQVFSMHIPLTGLASAASFQTGHVVFDPGPMLFFLLSAPVRIDPAHGLMSGGPRCGRGSRCRSR